MYYQVHWRTARQKSRQTVTWRSLAILSFTATDRSSSLQQPPWGFRRSCSASQHHIDGVPIKRTLCGRWLNHFLRGTHMLGLPRCYHRRHVWTTSWLQCLSAIPVAFVPSGEGSLKLKNSKAVQEDLRLLTPHYKDITEVKQFGRHGVVVKSANLECVSQIARMEL